MHFLNPYRLVLEMRKPDGSPIGQAPLKCDWEPALECARFSAARRLQIALVGSDATAQVRPLWDSKRGQPYVGALDIALQVPGAGGVMTRVPTSYFKAEARQAVAAYVQQGALQSGEAFDYLVAAFHDTTLPAAEPKARFELEELPVPLRLKSSLLSDFVAKSVLVGSHDEQDIRVFIPQTTLEEVDALTREAGAVEVASILIGHLHRDRASGDLFLEVTAQIPARHTVATSAKVLFTHETWTAALGLINLRRSDEEMVGWFHSHPARHWCNPKCPPEARARCFYQQSFFSEQDCGVQRTVFARASSFALLVTDTDAGLQHAAFSWRNGLIQQRGFNVLQTECKPDVAATSIVSPAAIVGEPEYEKNC